MEAWKVLLIFCWLYSCLHCSPADLPTALGSADVTLAWADAGQTVTTSPVVGDRNEGKSCNCQWILYVCIRVSWSRWKLALVLSGWCSVTIACHWATSSKEEETFIVLHLFSYSCACSAHVMGLSPPARCRGWLTCVGKESCFLSFTDRCSSREQSTKAFQSNSTGKRSLLCSSKEVNSYAWWCWWAQHWAMLGMK